MDPRKNLSLSMLPKLSEYISTLLSYTREQQHLFAPLERSQELRQLIPEALKLRSIDLCASITRAIPLHQNQCEKWLQMSLAPEERQKIITMQKELTEIKNLQ
jgi:hypothetical protein